MGLLEGDIAKAIYSGFRNKLLKGTLARSVPSTTLDEYGDPVGMTETNHPCEGFVESFSAYFRATVGIPETDVSIMIFAQSIDVEPTKDDIVTFRGTRYQVRKLLEIDPAVATYRLQGYKI